VLPRILPNGLLIGLDVDPLELPRTEERLRSSFPAENILIRRINFAGISKALAEKEIPGVHMILADLGVSSMQIDNPARGFTFKVDGPLDLRMNPERGQPASALLKQLTEERLAELLRQNADEPHAAALAQCIASSRTPIATTQQLASLIRGALKRLTPEEQTNAIRRTFQALRIAVNDEFGALDSLLAQIPACLLPGGRVAILTFHSGEDRRVKHSFKAGLESGVYSRISEEVVRPTAQEVGQNPRASSAKLRWAVRANAEMQR